MAHAPVYNVQGESAGTMELPDAIFAVAPNMTLVHQVYTALRSNAREPWADTKKRGEVRGGGKKPWQQKGTGRARHGSIRSPIWKGGGVTFGPLSVRNYKKKINKQMSRQAVRMCLSDKITGNAFGVVETLPTSGKTKEFYTLRSKVPGALRSTLLIVSEMNDAVKRGARNLPKFEIRTAADVNVLDLLHHQTVLATSDSIASLEKRFA